VNDEQVILMFDRFFADFRIIRCGQDSYKWGDYSIGRDDDEWTSGFLMMRYRGMEEDGDFVVTARDSLLENVLIQTARSILGDMIESTRETIRVKEESDQALINEVMQETVEIPF
jgi:hypothetical protein